MIRTFVTVGNARQPFSRLLEAVVAVADVLPGPVLVQRGHTLFDGSGVEVVDFIAMDRFSELVAQADVLIMHAGAGSVIHAVRAGKVPVVMPRSAHYGEHVDDHQHEFARELEKTGKVVLAHDAATIVSAARLALQRQQMQAAQAPREAAMVGMVRRALGGAPGAKSSAEDLDSMK